MTDPPEEGLQRETAVLGIRARLKGCLPARSAADRSFITVVVLPLVPEEKLRCESPGEVQNSGKVAGKRMDRGITRWGSAGPHSKSSVLFHYKQYTCGQPTSWRRPCSGLLLIGSARTPTQTPANMSRAKAAVLLLLLAFAAGQGEQEAQQGLLSGHWIALAPYTT